jgi:hypothetical protein
MSEYADEIMLPENGEDKDVQPECLATFDDCEVRRVGVTFKLRKGEDVEYVKCNKRFQSKIYPNSY